MKRVVIDIEANSLTQPTEIWIIVCKDYDTGELTIFRKVTQDADERARFSVYASTVDYWIGHNILDYDHPVLLGLLSVDLDNGLNNLHDTLLVSRMADFSREMGHSIESYGVEFNLPKGSISDFSKFSSEMELYCIRDVEICSLIYKKYIRFINNNIKPISTEILFHRKVVRQLRSNGFYFNKNLALRYLDKVTKKLERLDNKINLEFKPKLKLVREIIPTYTKHGTLHKKDFKWYKSDDLTEFNGGPFCLCHWQTFNPASHKQIIDVLTEAKWRPEDKTKTHIQTEREFTKTKSKELLPKLEILRKYGWKINEHNLETLPSDAPSSARTIAERILYEARRRTFVEWIDLIADDDRIHGNFQGIGAWTQRMSHQSPNTANIANEYDTAGKVKLYGKEMRTLWCSPPNRLLVGVDAEGIQLRIFAHYINDPEFTDALIRGKKEDKSDPHSLNQRILGSVCKTRAAAKRFIYALLLGAGIGKLAEVLECDKDEASRALNRLMDRYQGFLLLKEDRIPRDAKRGWFKGLDGRQVPIPGDTVGNRKHLCMSGYLQNGEAVIMKLATLKWIDQLPDLDAKLVNFVHDEWQTECPNDFNVALKIAKLQADSLRVVGEELQLNCPLAGSYWNDDHKDYTIGTNWYQTH